MQVDILIRRFARHNQRFQAYLDLMRMIGFQILNSENPAPAFDRYQPLIQDFLTFLETEELQHEKEEEKLIFPSGEADSSPFADHYRDHVEGGRLIRSLRKDLSRLTEAGIQQQDFLLFAAALGELSVHFKRHIEREQEEIRPVLTRMLVEEDDRTFLPEPRLEVHVT